MKSINIAGISGWLSQNFGKTPYGKWVCFLNQRTCITKWWLCSFSLNFLFNFVHFQSPNIFFSLPFNQFAICLFCLLSNSRLCAAVAQCRMFKCLFRKGRSSACLLITNAISLYLYLSSQQPRVQVKVAPMLSSMPSISEWEAKLPLTLFCSCAPLFCFIW